MKKITLGFSLLVASTLFILGCKKKEPNVAPYADTEVQTAIDASLANFIVTDIDMILSYVGENNLFPTFYLPAPGSPTFVVNRDPASKSLIVTFNQTKCMDGHTRTGSLFLRYSADPDFNPNPPPNTDYYRDFGFIGRVSLLNYRIDDWLVTHGTGSSPAGIYELIIKNKRKNANKPVVDTLAWTIEGSLNFTNKTDSVPTMAWKGLITKKLRNMTAVGVFSNTATFNSAVNWDLAKVGYTGSFSGYTAFKVPYSYKIYDATPLVRDFSCYPDKVAAVYLGSPGTTTVASVYEEFHPFISGVASFTTNNVKKVDSLPLYPREIYFDNGDNTYGGPTETISLPVQCDNKGAVQIKGIFYPVDFKK